MLDATHSTPTPTTFGALRVGDFVRRSIGRVRITAIEPNAVDGINGQPVNNLGASLVFDGDVYAKDGTLVCATTFVGRELQVLGRDCQVAS